MNAYWTQFTLQELRDLQEIPEDNDEDPTEFYFDSDPFDEDKERSLNNA